MMYDSTPDEHDRGKAGRSRRRLLAGAAGALGLLAGGTIGRATPARAGFDGDVVLGASNFASSETSIDTSASSAETLLVTAAAAAALDAQNSGNAPCVLAANVAVSGGSAAVSGRSTSGEGLYAQSGTTNGSSPGQTRNGVHGVTDSADDSAVWGEAVAGGTGVAGSTTSSISSASAGVTGTNFGDGPAVKGVAAGAGAALFGVAWNGSEGLYAQSGGRAGTSAGVSSTGVHGVSDAFSGTAVWGENVGGGAGVLGTTSRGTAVLGRATAPAGVGVAAVNTGGGPALEVDGPARFARSGTTTIRFPRTSATVTVRGRLSASALVLAVLQNLVPGVWMTAAVPDTKTGQVRLHLNKAPGTATKPMTARVAWFVVN